MSNIIFKKITPGHKSVLMKVLELLATDPRVMLYTPVKATIDESQEVIDFNDRHADSIIGHYLVFEKKKHAKIPLGTFSFIPKAENSFLEYSILLLPHVIGKGYDTKIAKEICHLVMPHIGENISFMESGTEISFTLRGL